ncbi:MAG: ATP-dependent DNA ligase [Propionibacteriaceae bacterium]|nr:ATP-dependent DNA ligase [Propionibacteriaceae bacterium]
MESLPLARVVAALDTVSATASRTGKAVALAGLLAASAPDDLPALVGVVRAQPRQGRLGVGWRTVSARLAALAEVADAPSTTGTEDNRLTVADVDAAFTALAGVPAGTGSSTARTRILDRLLARASASERDFLGRVLVGELRTGALDGLLVDAVARASGQPVAVVRRAAMLSGDLGGTARRALTEPATLADVSLSVGVPVLPMLASTAASVADALAITGEASVEYKLDGARIQVHRDGEEVLVVTRSLADVTDRLPEVVAAVRALPVERVILDGETLLLGEDGAPRPFQDTMARFGARGGDAVLRPWFFDVLHADGRDLIDEPLAERRRVLREVVGERMIPGLVTADPDAAAAFAAEALAAGHEGVLVKGIASTYAAGRRGKAWVKVKPVRTVDLVVLACEWGSGRRRGTLSNLHLGARDPDGQFGAPGGFVMVGKTFKGLTDALLAWQTERFGQIETRRDAWTVHVRPEVVVEIAFDGVQRSSRYPGGVALRFARVKGYRSDKSAREADTIGELRAGLIGPPAETGLGGSDDGMEEWAGHDDRKAP